MNSFSSSSFSSSEQQQQQEEVQEDEEQQSQQHEFSVAELRKQGYEGVALFEKIATRTIAIKERSRVNRCHKCWHDVQTRCICSHLPSFDNNTSLPVKVLLLMHYKEFMSAGNDAKLLVAMLPKEKTQLYIFGKHGDWDKFHDECNVDPSHTIILWPNEDSLTIDDYISNRLPKDSPWKGHYYSNRLKRTSTTTSSTRNLPTLRVILLDGVYQQARNMFRAIGKRFDKSIVPPHIALQPTTLSVYHRAQNKYASYSAVTVSKSMNHPDAFHICTVEAFALLMKELKLDGGGETGGDAGGDDDEDSFDPTTSSWTEKLVLAVQINNKALKHSHDVRPPPSAV